MISLGSWTPGDTGQAVSKQVPIDSASAVVLTAKLQECFVDNKTSPNFSFEFSVLGKLILQPQGREALLMG